MVNHYNNQGFKFSETLQKDQKTRQFSKYMENRKLMKEKRQIMK